MERKQQIGLAVLAALVIFLIGFLPQWSRAKQRGEELERTRVELRLARLEGRLGAALTESLRSNYEKSRQLMADFYTELQAGMGAVEEPRRREALTGILRQRDEMITLLSRAQPESTQRLMLLYTTYHAAVDPAAHAAPAVTPPPPPPPAAPAAPPAAPRDTAGKR